MYVGKDRMLLYSIKWEARFRIRSRLSLSRLLPLPLPLPLLVGSSGPPIPKIPKDNVFIYEEWSVGMKFFHVIAPGGTAVRRQSSSSHHITRFEGDVPCWAVCFQLPGSTTASFLRRAAT